jgi:hypothetical protein
VHLVVYIIRICHDARSHERKIKIMNQFCRVLTLNIALGFMKFLDFSIVPYSKQSGRFQEVGLFPL